MTEQIRPPLRSRNPSPANADLHYGHRYYNPSIGRWPNRDPIGEKGGANLYAFVHNNALRYIDPFGLEKILCVYCNVCERKGAGLAGGHAALAFFDTDTKGTTTYGLWPDTHPHIVAGGLANGDGSDVRVNFPNDNPKNYPYKHCREIDAKQVKKLNEVVSKNWKWRYTQTCASFASDVFKQVTAVDIDADDTLGFETPREVGDSIQDANGGEDSNEGTNPIPPAPGVGGNTSSKK